MKIEGGEERRRRRKGGFDAEKRNGMPRRNRGVPALMSNVACVAVRSNPWEPRLGLACAVGLGGLGWAVGPVGGQNNRASRRLSRVLQRVLQARGSLDRLHAAVRLCAEAHLGSPTSRQRQKGHRGRATTMGQSGSHLAPALM